MFREDRQAKVDFNQASLNDEVKRVNHLDRESVKLLISEQTLKRQLQLKYDDSEEFKSSNIQLVCAVAHQRLSQPIIKYVREVLQSFRSDADKYHQRVFLYTERLAVDVTDRFSVFQYNFGTTVKTLLKKQRKDNETTSKTDPVSIDGFLRSIESKRSLRGTFSQFS